MPDRHHLTLARTDRIRAAVILSAPTDMSSIVAYRRSIRPDDDLETFCLADAIPGSARNRKQELEARSPIRWPEKLNRKTPILLFHGTSDGRVSPQDTLAMGAALQRLEHPYRLVMLEGGGHGLDLHIDEVDS